MNTIIFIRSTNIYDDSRATKEIFALCDAGYKVIIVGWDRNGKSEENLNEVFRDKNVELSLFNYPINGGIGLKNIKKLLLWFKWCKETVKKYNSIVAVHACNLDSALGVAALCKKTKIPLIYDIYDYYADSHTMSKGVGRIVERLEKSIINGASATIICTEEREEQIKGSHPKKLIVIHNSPEVNEITPVDTVFDYAYCGSLCERRLVNEIMLEYKNHQDLSMVFAGNDTYYSVAEDTSKKYNNFTFEGTVPYSKVIELESKSKVLSAIYEPTIRNHRLCAPNKFYEALALSKPVIVCKGTGIDKIVEKYGIGMVIGYDVEQFYEALNTLISDEEMRINMGQKARELYDCNYRWAIMKKRLIDLYMTID